MHKSIFVATGAVALAGAVMPVAGVFATIDPSTATTNISVSVTATDSISTGGDVTFAALSLGSDGTKTDSKTQTVSVDWHDNKAYTITYAGADLTATGNSTRITPTTSAVDAGDNQWGLADGSVKLAANGGTLVASSTSKGNGQTKTLTYSVKIADSLEAGSYSGSITYTLAAAS